MTVVRVDRVVRSEPPAAGPARRDGAGDVDGRRAIDDRRLEAGLGVRDAIARELAPEAVDLVLVGAGEDRLEGRREQVADALRASPRARDRRA